ncbi:hypothetical protein HU200_005199 [Digitaria exilis]|uniref:Uncharacterized protein n=1 Tax=Digitaria exilis TaxID=1010633 RepID=A0A835FS08_9POAL|nr:hypothetical protein HU200_005199 [Digitaria exilis]
MATAVAQEQQQQQHHQACRCRSPHFATISSPSCPRHHPRASIRLPAAGKLPAAHLLRRPLAPTPARRAPLPLADVHAIVSNLKDSLSRVLNAFYPLAGRLRLTPPGTSNRYELHYRPGDGVAFTVAEYAGDDSVFDGLATDNPRADASPPVTDRSHVPDPTGLYDAFFKATSTSTTNETEAVEMPMHSEKLLATFTLSRDDIQRVKDVVAAEATRRGATPPRCTTLVATLGFVWSCYQRAKEATSTGGDGQNTCLLFPVDHRSRTNPPLPANYLGNCVGPAFALAPKAALAGGGAGGLLSACAAVAAAIDEAVRGVGTDSMCAWMDRFREVAGAMSMLTVAGSQRFRVYEMDMGFGSPEKVDIVSVARTGALAVAESRRGDGGVEVGVPLTPDDMDRFSKCFADSITGLHAHS